MKKIILKYGGMLAALAMVFTTLTVNLPLSIKN